MTDFILPRLQFGRAHSLGRGRAFSLYLVCRTSEARQKKDTASSDGSFGLNEYKILYNSYYYYYQGGFQRGC